MQNFELFLYSDFSNSYYQPTGIVVLRTSDELSFINICKVMVQDDKGEFRCFIFSE